MATHQEGDPRAALFGAQEWCASLVGGVDDTQLFGATPCTEFDVRALIAHIGLIFEKLVAFGELKRDPRFGEEVTQDALARAQQELAERYVDDQTPAERSTRLRELAAQARPLWTDALLDEPIQLGWGPVLPGKVVAAIYLMECLAHGWDLATATGQDPEAPEAVAQPGLEAALAGLPRSPRGDEVGVPFGPVVESADNAGPTEQLANWTGRTSRD